MRYACICWLAFILAACSANPDRRVAREAAVAMTGSPGTVTAVGSLTMEGSGTVFDAAGANLQPKKYAVKSFQRVINFRRGGQVWQQEIREGGVAPQLVVRAVFGKTAFNVNAEGAASGLPDQDARDRREQIYQHPIGFLEAALAVDAKVGNSRTEGNEDAMDLTVDNVVYTMHISRDSRLPTRVSSRVRNGESTLETSFDNYVKVHGYLLPSHIVMKLDQAVTADLKIERQNITTDTVRLPTPAGIRIDLPAGRGRGGEASASF